jgi:hypothetical protein
MQSITSLVLSVACTGHLITNIRLPFPTPHLRPEPSLHETHYSASHSPQYWMNDSLGISATLGAYKPPAGLYRTGITSQLTVMWRATPNFAFTPFIGGSYFAANDGFPAFQSRNLGFGTTYTLDREWALYATGSVSTRPAQTTSSGMHSHNFRNNSISLGVRRSF